MNKELFKTEPHGAQMLSEAASDYPLHNRLFVLKPTTRTYSDPLTETSCDPLPTVCAFCGCTETRICWTPKNPGILFRCGTLWLPVSAYAKRAEPEWKQYEACRVAESEKPLFR